MQTRLLFLGPPGAGKGTQAQLLCKKYDLMHLSTGDMLRSEVSAGSPLGIEAAELMNKGELVSDSLVLSIVENRLNEASQGWLLDGFPRTVDQAEALSVLLGKIQQPIQAVVVITLDAEFLIKRLLGRGRTDDNETVIRHRLEVYKEKTAPLIAHYTKEGLVKTVKGDGDVLEIASRIEAVLS